MSANDPAIDDRHAFTIDCDTCALQHSSACDDCIVTFLCGPIDRDAGVVVNLAEARALRTLGDAGLAPPLRHRRAR